MLNIQVVETAHFSTGMRNKIEPGFNLHWSNF
jgi:hypothetical protein